MTATATAPPRPAIDAGRQRPVYTRIQALGLLMAAAAPALMLSAALLAGMAIPADELTFFVPLIVVPLAAAALVYRFGTWAKILGLVVAAAAGFMLFWTVFGLSYPSSPADLLPGILLPGGVLIALAGGVAALVAKRRGRMATSATKAETRIAGAALGLVVLAAVVSGTWMMLARDSVAADDALAVTMADFAFDQEAYTIPAGEPTEVLVHNSDAFVHTFTAPELGIDETVVPGGDAMIEITGEPGTYTLYCTPHSDPTAADAEEAGMVSQIVIE